MAGVQQQRRFQQQREGIMAGNVLYKFVCGCCCVKPRRNRNRVRPHRYHLCPSHGEPIIIKIFECEKCGEWVERSLKTPRLKFCDPCKIKLGKNRKHPTGAVNTANPPSRKPDCKYYDHCLSGILQKNSRACQHCSDYVYQALDAADYLFTRSK